MLTRKKNEFDTCTIKFEFRFLSPQHQIQSVNTVFAFATCRGHWARRRGSVSPKRRADCWRSAGGMERTACYNVMQMKRRTACDGTERPRPRQTTSGR